ncbi:Do family serine endopeptidase [Sphingoaurantiacus capsulatus]|uniref:Probable periplasmic serine endoprotease DegP-like n=1 Tax=Sphingoaurantiacus capsulatus TaxID=1771310 RepID=A0ABV7X9Z8_9SPHN
MRIALALTGTALAVGSAATLALQSPAGAQAVAQAPQNAPATVPSVGPGGAPRSFADLTARLQPAVVNISTTQQIEVGRRLPRFTPGTPLDELFRRFQDQQGGGATGEGGEPVTREASSLGSGFFISPDGYLVTNNHVITGRSGEAVVDKITVTLSDRREFEAKVIGRDPLSDMALLKINATGLPYVNFGDSANVRVGDWVVAIGNPFGLGGTVTAGIVSALHRNIGASQYERYIQTDASINQGNSGGPLFDLDGNVVGINTAIFSPTGGNVGLGFSIPAELARPVIEQLRATGRVRRGYLGVNIQPLSTDIAAGLGLPKDRGEIVASVEPTGPASRAGIRQGDVIVKVNNQEVTVDNTLSYIVANTPIGRSVPIELIRDGQRRTINVTTAERPTETALNAQTAEEPDEPTATPPAGEASARQSLGITLSALTPEVRRQLRVAEDARGVVIASLNPNSDAARQGLQRGDLIVSINQRPTTTVAAAAAAVDAARRAGRDTVLLLFQRGTGPARFIGIKLMAPTPPATTPRR